jgi:hypothetical protein
MPKRISFSVVGYAPFPLDMLRRDACWPADTEAVNQLDDVIQQTPDTGPAFHIDLESYYPPTIARWESFDWLVK